MRAAHTPVCPRSLLFVCVADASSQQLQESRVQCEALLAEMRGELAASRQQADLKLVVAEDVCGSCLYRPSLPALPPLTSLLHHPSSPLA